MSGMLIQHRPDFGGERDRSERLLLEWGPGVEQPALDDVFTGVPRHEEDGQTGVRKGQALAQFPPPHFRHHHVGDYQVDRAGMFPDVTQTLGAISGFHHRVPVISQPSARQVPHHIFVLDNQDGLRAACRRRNRGTG